ncbi:MAG: hypothetical protein ACLR60_13430 [Clostridium paraputrificum]
MGLFNRVKGTTTKITIEQLTNIEYKQFYLNECKFIWKNYVPKNGQAKFLQGELLRELEKLRCEAQDNGNINWDEDFSYFCDFIRESLCTEDIFSKIEKEKISLALTHIKTCGDYARRFYDGEILEHDVDVNRLAYIGDNLYDIVADAIGFLQMKINKPIPYKYNEMIKR